MRCVLFNVFLFEKFFSFAFNQIHCYVRNTASWYLYKKHSCKILSVLPRENTTVQIFFLTEFSTIINVNKTFFQKMHLMDPDLVSWVTK